MAEHLKHFRFQAAMARPMRDVSTYASSSSPSTFKQKPKTTSSSRLPVSVQYHVIPDHVYEAYYKLANPRQQICPTCST